MRDNRVAAERGQTLVLVALLMVGLLAGTGLAIDGGTAFLERRRMQNAADGAVMAGTREMVEARADEDENGDDRVWNTIHHYAQVNGVEDPENNVVADYVNAESAWVGDVGGGSIPEEATGISTTVRIERAAHFMQIVGINIVPAEAFALAQSGRPEVTGGAKLRPFGLPSEIFEDSVRSTGPITFTFANKCYDKDTNVCNIFWTAPDGTQQEKSHRGWWMYNVIDPENGKCPNPGGAYALKEWMEEGWVGPIWDDAKVCSKEGVNASAFDKAPLYDPPICIPVYDDYDTEMDAYVVKDIAAVRVTGYSSPKDKGPNNVKWIRVELLGEDEGFECPALGGTDPGENSTGAINIVLWK